MIDFFKYDDATQVLAKSDLSLIGYAQKRPIFKAILKKPSFKT